jgi:hypothetical protein
MNHLLYQLADSEAESGYEVNAEHLRAVAGLLAEVANMDSEDKTVRALILKARELTKE